jgi:hypothetical protein
VEQWWCSGGVVTVVVHWWCSGVVDWWWCSSGVMKNQYRYQ